MALVVEDGTIVAGANSMASVADADAYFAARGNAAWAGLDDEAKEVALIAGSDYLKDEGRYPWSGSRIEWDQPMPWPRTGAFVRNGPAIPDNVVPPAVRDAVVVLAGKSSAGVVLLPDFDRGGAIKRKTIDVITTEWYEGASPMTLYTAVQGLVVPYLRPAGALPEGAGFMAVGVDTATPPDNGFFSFGMNDNPRAGGR